MKKFKCDICGIEVGEFDLTTLSGNYASNDIKEVCVSCYREINQVLVKIENILNETQYSWVKSFLIKFKLKKTNKDINSMAK